MSAKIFYVTLKHLSKLTDVYGKIYEQNTMRMSLYTSSYQMVFKQHCVKYATKWVFDDVY